MVTIEEAKEQIQTARQTLQQQREELPTPTPTRRELAEGVGGIEARQRRRERTRAITERRTEIETGLSKLKEVEKEVEKEEQRVVKAEAERQAKIQAQISQQKKQQELISRFVRDRPLRKGERLEIEKLLQENPQLRERIESIKLRQDVAQLSEAELQSLTEEQIKRLTGRGLIKVVEVEVPPSVISVKPEPVLIKGETIKDLEKLRLEKREIFAPSLKGFVQATEAEGRVFGQATAVIRPPTPEEIQRIERAAFRGSLAGIQEGERKLELKLFGERKVEIKPGIFEKITGKKPEPELPPFATKPFDIGAEALLRAGEFIERKIVPPEVSAKVPQVSRKEAKRLLSDVLKIVTFAPLIKTGGTVIGKKSKLAEIELAKFEEAKLIRAGELREALRVSSTREVQDYVQRQLRLINTKNIPLKEKEELTKSLLKFVKESRKGIIDLDVVATTPTIITTPKPVTVTIEVPPIPKIKGITRTFVGESTLQFEQVGQLPIQKGILGLKPLTKQEQKKKQITKQVLSLELKQTQVSKQVQEQIAEQRTKQVSKLLSALALATPQLQAQRQVPRTTPETRFGRPLREPPRRPRVPPPVGFPKKPLLQRLAEKVEKEPEAFTIFVRKEGKDVKIGKARTKEEAFTKLRKRLKATIRASGFVKGDGKKVRPRLKFGGEFRISKEDPFRLVQKKVRRLGTREETKEIQFFRSKKKGGKLLGL